MPSWHLASLRRLGCHCLQSAERGKSARQPRAYSRCHLNLKGHRYLYMRAYPHPVYCTFSGGTLLMKPSSRILAFAAIGVLILTSVFLGVSARATHAAAAFPSQLFAPYQDITLSGPTLQSVTQSTGQKFYTLAFVTDGGNNCTAEWAGTIPFSQTGQFLPNLDSDISFIRSQGGDVIISFGGAAGQELALTCPDATSLQAQYQAVINKYHVNHLDFDIEGGTEGDVTSYDRRNTALAALQQANPGLVISFTLPSATTGLQGERDDQTRIGLL